MPVGAIGNRDRNTYARLTSPEDIGGTLLPVSGTVYLAGGGSPADEAQVWGATYAGVARVLYWPFALGAEMLGTSDGWFRAALHELGLSPEVTTWTTLEGHDSLDLESFDLVHVGGGNTFRLLDHIRCQGFIDPLRSFVGNGGRYYGGSAGAILACDDIRTAVGHDPNFVGLTDLTSLGLVTSRFVEPHYKNQDSSTALGQRILGIPERGGVGWDGHLFTALGPDPTYDLTAAGRVRREPGESWSPVLR